MSNGRSHNGRFGVMAAVTPQKRQCKFASLYPAGSVVEAYTTPSRLDVVCNVGQLGYYFKTVLQALTE